MSRKKYGTSLNVCSSNSTTVVLDEVVLAEVLRCYICGA